MPCIRGNVVGEKAEEEMDDELFGRIWDRFSWIIDESRRTFMFEGYVLNISLDNLAQNLLLLDSHTIPNALKNSTWADGTSELDWNKEYSFGEYMDFFKIGKLVSLLFTYERQFGKNKLQFLLILSKYPCTWLEIVCYLEPILDSADSKETVREAISHFQELKDLFDGETLFVGPETASPPISKDNYPKEWMRI